MIKAEDYYYKSTVVYVFVLEFRAASLPCDIPKAIHVHETEWHTKSIGGTERAANMQ